MNVPDFPRKHSAPIFLALGLLPFWGLSAAWADDGINTDRPDFVESSQVVGAGRFQLETGLAFERSTDEAGTRLRGASTPTLLRLGVNDRVELRVETDGFMRLKSRPAGSSAETEERGFADVSLGLKWHTQDGDEAGGKPSMAWLAHLDVDSGSSAWRGSGLRPSVRLVAEWELPGELSLGVMPGLMLDRNDAGERFASGILAATLGKAWNDRWRSFVEVAAQQIASTKNGGSVVTFDLGGAWSLSKSVQVDAALSRGLTRYSPDLQWTLGLAVKY